MQAGPSIEGRDFKRLERGSLLGFATIHLPDLGLTITDVGVFEKDGRRWIVLPAKPMIGREGVTLKGDDGKVRYQKILEFDCKEAANEFSRNALEALSRWLP